jgi:hypothetical protein
MNNISAMIPIFLLAFTAIAAPAEGPVEGPHGERYEAGWPLRVVNAQGLVVDSPTVETCIDAGCHLASAETIARWASEDEEKRAAAEAVSLAEAEKAEALAAAVAYADEKSKKDEAAKLEAIAAAASAGGKKPSDSVRLDIHDKALGITWK